MRTCFWECPSADVVPLCLAFCMGMSRNKVTSWLRASVTQIGVETGIRDPSLLLNVLWKRTACPFVFQKSALYCLGFYRIRISIFGFMCYGYVGFETHFGVYVSFKKCCSNCICRQQCLSPHCEQVGNRPIETHSRKTLVDSAHDQVWANQDQSCWDHLEPSSPWHQNSFSWQTQNAWLHVDRMGEQQYLRATQADWNKQTIKEICNVSFSNSS